MLFYFSYVNEFLPHTSSKSWLIESLSDYYSYFCLSLLILGQSARERARGWEWGEGVRCGGGLNLWDEALGNPREAGHKATLLKRNDCMWGAGRMGLQLTVWDAARTREGIHRTLKSERAPNQGGRHAHTRKLLRYLSQSKNWIYLVENRELTSFLKILSNTANENAKCTVLYY